MQTFLPYPDFRATARALDMKRLGKQRVEAKQVYLALTTPDYGWQNHPAVKMWKGHEAALCHYGAAICREWISRGYRDTLLPFFSEKLENLQTLPRWLGDPAFHASHRSNLLRKAPEWYSQFGWDESPTLDYVWPTSTL